MEKSKKGTKKRKGTNGAADPPPAAAPTGKNSARKISVVDRPTVERLAVDLLPDEINAYARESARLHGDIAKAKQEAKDKNADFKAKIGGMETRVGDLNRKIESGKEDREVPCIWRIEYDKGTKTLFRKGKIVAGEHELIEIKSYPLLPEERQMNLPIAETLSDKVRKIEENKNAKPDDKEKGNGATNVLDFPDGDDEDDKRTEADEEKKVRIWCNGLSADKRKEAFGITEMGEANGGLLSLPYRRMTEADREIVRGHFKAYTEKADSANA